MIIPAIDLLDGQIVRLYQGDYARQTAFELPLKQQLQGYIDQGAQWLHLVDLSGARQPDQAQTALLRELLCDLSAKVQVGGGIRTEAQLEAMLEAGADRVVIGSMAVTAPDTVQQWLHKYGSSAICLALDIQIDHQGQKIPAIHGWQQAADTTLEKLIDRYLTAGLEHVLVTDISRDGTLSGANTALYRELAAHYGQIHWQASGGIATLEDINDIKQSGAAGVIVGRALLQGNFNVKEAVTCWPNV